MVISPAYLLLLQNTHLELAPLKLWRQHITGFYGATRAYNSRMAIHKKFIFYPRTLYSTRNSWGRFKINRSQIKLMRPHKAQVPNVPPLTLT